MKWKHQNEYTDCTLIIISVSKCLLTSPVITLSNSCSVADCGYLSTRPCMIHNLWGFFCFVFPLCWLTDQRDFLASSSPSYCMTSFWVILLSSNSPDLIVPVCLHDCEPKIRVCQRLEVRRLTLTSGRDYVLIRGWDIVWDVPWMCICVFVICVKSL